MEYKLDDTLLLKSYLKNRWNKDTSIELIIRPECNQKCDYCYITQYGDELYPKEERANNEKILNNLKMLLDFFLEQKFYCSKWELFAGDLFYDDLWFDIMDIFENYFSNNNFQNKENNIIIPCNCSFFHDKEKTEKISQYIEKFEQNGIRISFSWSHDGQNLSFVREKREISSDFYDTAFNFLQRHHYGAHPMISKEGIDGAIEQYKWWIEQWKKLNRQEYSPMFLEVRNDNWDDESVSKYLSFLNYVIEDRFSSICHNDPKLLAYHLFTHEQKQKELHLKTVPSDFASFHCLKRDGEYKNCTLGKSYSINIATLSLVPCHRLNYKFFRAANFVVSSTSSNTNEFKIENTYLKDKVLTKNSKIIDIEAQQGLSAYLNITSANPMFAPGCCVCEFRYLCIKGCYGSQFESYGDWSMPIPSVCKLLKAKYNFMLIKSYELGALQEVLKEDFPLEKEIKKYYTYHLKRLREEGKIK